MAKTIIFGDIHGCFDEWQDLIEKIGPSSDDKLISVGDIVCKGPKTLKCLKYAQKKNIQCVMGNHEYQLLKHWETDRLDELPKKYQKDTIKELGKDLDNMMSFIQLWPTHLDLPECLVVHAGIRAGIPLNKQNLDDLLYLRTIEPEGLPWYDFYKEDRLIVHGHWARQGLVVKKNVIGLDSGCVYGNELSAVILPERKIVSVPARKTYVKV